MALNHFDQQKHKDITTNTIPDTTGVILVGGKSRRMGQDKAFLTLDGKPLIERLLDVFKDCFSNILLVGDNGARFSAYDVPTVADIYPGSSLGGLYSGLYHAIDNNIFVASCDLVNPSSEVIRKICSLKGDYDAVIPNRAHGYEPLCALYTKTCLPAMKQQLESGNHCILDLYPLITIKAALLDELTNQNDADSAFLSVNTPEEFEAVKKEISLCN